jgi:hypothetical protein
VGGAQRACSLGSGFVARPGALSVTSHEPGPFDRFPPGRVAWWRPAALAFSCLVIGLVAGYLIRGGTDQADVAAVDPAERAATPGPVTVTAPTAPAAPPPRARVQIAVLNGTDITGFAARTADQAEGAGYVDVIAEDAPEPNPGATVVYFRDEQRPAAVRLARDIGLAGAAIRRLPPGGALAAGAPPGAGVIVVLGLL